MINRFYRFINHIITMTRCCHGQSVDKREVPEPDSNTSLCLHSEPDNRCQAFVFIIKKNFKR